MSHLRVFIYICLFAPRYILVFNETRQVEDRLLQRMLKDAGASEAAPASLLHVGRILRSKALRDPLPLACDTIG